ncbi:MAG TPA: hypothetical protein DHW49_06225, partial [Anaerolineae bacterium]|nr:hypothetical protein [Anaerolineae bacterium]
PLPKPKRCRQFTLDNFVSRMKFRKVKDTTGTGHHSLVEVGDFEFVNPTNQISEMFISSRIFLERDFLRFVGFPIDNPIALGVLTKKIKKEWDEKYKELKSVDIPEPLLKVLTVDSKKEQIRLLKNLSLNNEQLVAFLIRAGEDFGYSYSQYTGEHLPKGLADKKLPTLAELKEDGEVKIIGETEMTKGQVKQSIEQRHVAVSKFLDKGDKWHCLMQMLAHCT